MKHPPGLPDTPGSSLQTATASPVTLLDRARRWVMDLHTRQQATPLPWHNFAQTNALVAHCQGLVAEEQTDPEHTLPLLTAAWFAYAGWLFDTRQPVETAIKLAAQFLEAEKVPTAQIRQVRKLIPLAHLEGEPKDTPGRLLWDAAIALHYGAQYAEARQLRRREAEQLSESPIDGSTWRRQEWSKTLRLQCYTASGRALIEPHLVQVRQELDRKRLRERAPLPPSADAAARNGVSLNSSVQTYFRTTYHTHIHLSGIADRKAQMLLSINAILLSVLITVLSYSNLAETRPPLLIPITLFMAFGLGSLLFAVRSAIPRITRHPLTGLAPEERRRKLLFFGNFTQLDPEQYAEEMSALLEKGEWLQEAMHQDIYFMGKVLDQKFRMVSLAYILFLTGFLGAVVSFLLIHFFFL